MGLIAKSLQITDIDPDGKIIPKIVKKFVYLGEDLDYKEEGVILDVLAACGAEPTDLNKQIAFQAFTAGQFTNHLRSLKKEAMRL